MAWFYIWLGCGAFSAYWFFVRPQALDGPVDSPLKIAAIAAGIYVVGYLAYAVVYTYILAPLFGH
jgi:hypothetical protein